jgi:1-acyl-sn-glycerol-3-phosphate acyltransferase
MVQRVRRRQSLGVWYRLAVFLLWPFMTLMTKRDWRGTAVLNDSTGGIVVAPNHVSWFDPLVIAHVLWANDRPPRFLAKEAMFRVPIIGKIIDGAGQIRVYRESADAAQSVRDAIRDASAGECVVIYPEGTITKDPELWPMAAKTGAARVALASGVPLIPMAQWGAHEVMRPYRKEFRIFPRKTMRVIFGQPVDLSDLRNQPINAETLAIAGERLMTAMTALLAELRDEERKTT